MDDNKLNSNWNWSMYYKAIGDIAPRETLTKALKLFSGFRGYAIDLGCGSGADTLELLRYGWEVLAVDKTQEGLTITENKTDPDFTGRLKTLLAKFEDIVLPKSDFINASLSLPFCQPEYFNRLWDQIVNSLRKDGRFAGNLFGDKDEWAKYCDMTFQTKTQIEYMFNNFEIEFFNEFIGEGMVAGGIPKHWHYYQIVAKKK